MSLFPTNTRDREALRRHRERIRRGGGFVNGGFNPSFYPDGTMVDVDSPRGYPDVVRPRTPEDPRGLGGLNARKATVGGPPPGSVGDAREQRYPPGVQAPPGPPRVQHARGPSAPPPPGTVAPPGAPPPPAPGGSGGATRARFGMSDGGLDEQGVPNTGASTQPATPATRPPQLPPEAYASVPDISTSDPNFAVEGKILTTQSGVKYYDAGGVRYVQLPSGAWIEHDPNVMAGHRAQFPGQGEWQPTTTEDAAAARVMGRDVTDPTATNPGPVTNKDGGTATDGTDTGSTDPGSTPSGGGPGNQRYTGFNFGRTQDVSGSVKDSFAQHSAAAPPAPTDKKELEAWFNQHVRPGIEADGHKVISVVGDKVTYEWQGKTYTADYAKNAGSAGMELAWGIFPKDQPSGSGTDGDKNPETTPTTDMGVDEAPTGPSGDDWSEINVPAASAGSYPGAAPESERRVWLDPTTGNRRMETRGQIYEEQPDGTWVWVSPKTGVTMEEGPSSRTRGRVIGGADPSNRRRAETRAGVAGASANAGGYPGARRSGPRR